MGTLLTIVLTVIVTAVVIYVGGCIWLFKNWPMQ